MLEYNQDQNKNFQTPVPNVVPVTDTRPSVEQFAVSQPKRKWWLIILISFVGILIIGGGVYAFLFFNKPVEKVVDEVVSPEPIVENEVATSTIDENLDTDSDGLRDLDEINIWKTDINNTDSDGDAYSDSDEVKNGYNPVGAGKLKVLDFSLATPEDALIAWAKAIHDTDAQLFLNIATSNNAKYPLTYDEGYDYLTWVRGFYGGKSITFEIISRENKADNILALEVRTLLDGEFFRDDSIELIQLDKKWWVYVPRYEN